MAFGFGVGGTEPARRESHISINVAPTSHEVNDTPEIRKYKKRFNSEILCASLWGEFIVLFQRKYSMYYVYYIQNMVCLFMNLLLSDFLDDLFRQDFVVTKIYEIYVCMCICQEWYCFYIHRLMWL